MSKCIEIHIPGMTEDTEGLYFEGVSESNLFDIITEITSGSSEVNGANLEILNEILNNLDKIKKTSESLTGNALDSTNIGDNVVGNASIMDISRILFRNEVKGSEFLLPMFNLLQSAGFKTSSSNIILTTDKKIKNGIHLGSKYFKIVLNPTKKDFVALLYKSLGYAYIDLKIKNKGKIRNVIESALDDVASQSSGVAFFDGKIADILKLDDNLKLRAFMAFIADPTNIPDTVKSKINKLSILIDADISKHIDENIEQTKEWIKYGKETYKKDSELINSTAASLKEQEHHLLNQKAAQYYHTEYGKDKEFISANSRKRNQSEEIKTLLAEARKRASSIEDRLSNPKKSGFVTVEFDPDEDYDKKLEDLKNTIANMRDISIKVQIYENKVRKLSAGWNPYLVNIKTDLLENILKPDLKFEVVEPRFITIGNKNISLLKLKDFMKGYYEPQSVLNAPEPAELAAILAKDNIVPLKDSLPYKGYLRKFLKDNEELFKLLWDPKNHPLIDADAFDVKTVVNKLTLENTLYLPYEDYKSSLMFDLRGLSVQYGEKSFTDPPSIRRVNDFSRDEKYLSVKFTPQKVATLKTKGNELVIPINEEIKALPPDVEAYLKINPTKELYLNLGENSNIDADKAAMYLKDVISLINNTEDVYRITKVTVKGLNNLQINVAKAVASMGIAVQVLDSDELKFQEAFNGYNVKSFPNDISYKFPDTGDLNLERALINNEVTGILYDSALKTQSDAWKLNKIQPGNSINLGFKSGNKFRGIVKTKVTFDPTKLAVQNNGNTISIGSKVLVQQKDGRGKLRTLSGHHYVVGISGNEKLISNGYQTFTLEEGQSLVFDKQYPLITRDGVTMFPIEGANILLEVNNGIIHGMSPEVFQYFYAEELEEVRRITGLSKKYTDSHINAQSAQTMGVVEITPIEKIDITPNADESISKADTESIISIFADKLNTIFGEKFVEIIDAADERFKDGETHHPAFIKDGKIFINVNHPAIHPGALVHELSHLILAGIKVSSPNVYYKIAESIDLEDKKYDNYKIKYKNRSRSDIQQEILADLFGKYFDRLILDYGSVGEAFEKLSLNDIFAQLFDIAGEIPKILTKYELMGMTINEAVNNTSSGFRMRKNLFDNDKLYQERKLSNFKEELIRNKNLKEECL